MASLRKLKRATLKWSRFYRKINGHTGVYISPGGTKATWRLAAEKDRRALPPGLTELLRARLKEAGVEDSDSYAGALDDTPLLGEKP